MFDLNFFVCILVNFAVFRCLFQWNLHLNAMLFHNLLLLPLSFSGLFSLRVREQQILTECIGKLGPNLNNMQMKEKLKTTRWRRIRTENARKMKSRLLALMKANYYRFATNVYMLWSSAWSLWESEQKLHSRKMHKARQKYTQKWWRNAQNYRVTLNIALQKQ